MRIKHEIFYFRAIFFSIDIQQDTSQGERIKDF